MKLLKKNRILITWLTIVILTNMISINLITNSFIRLPNTIVLKNDSKEFLSELYKANQLNILINKNYIGDIDNTKIGEDAITAMFESLDDPYSEYFTADEYETIMNSYSGSFGGIGVVIDGTNPDFVQITSVVEGSPAQEAGIQPGDIIKKVDGEDITGQSVDVVVSKTRGEIGTDVNIIVDRNGEDVEFNLTRSKIDNTTVYSENKDGIGYIYISQFGTGTEEQFKTELDKLLSENITDLIIDLRANGGGIVNSAVGVADYLLDQDILAYTLDKNNNRTDYTTKDGKIDIPFVILVDENTASASELLSGAVQKAGGTIIGTTTFGKGVVQSMSELLDGSGYKLTVQEYFLNDGTKVNKVGITPDIIVEFPEGYQVTDESEDLQLNKALEVLQNN